VLNPADVHWIEFSQTSGHEQSGRRPAIVMQDDVFGAGLPLVITIPLTTATRAGRFAGTVAIAPDEYNGLRRNSVALVFQVRAVDRILINERLGAIAPETLAEIHLQLDLLLGRPTPNGRDQNEESIE
jgi:mRNA interferase MazF